MGISLVKGMDIEMGKDWRTGLYTLKTFKQIVPALFENPEKLKYAAVLFIDADGLTYINETYGIDKGNVYLQGIAKCFYQCSAPMKIGTRRFDGDEFIFLLYGCESREELETYIEEIIQKQQGSYVEFGENLHYELKFSCGYAVYPEEGTDYASLNRLSTFRMYYDKRQRKRGNQE